MNPDQAQAVAQDTSRFHAAHGLALLIMVALAVIFLFHFMGFRFVGAVGVGFGSR